ncbi:hypothetical protein [Moorena sp. SIO4G3]|nr:hypothetical protein [Moorena sp. SIO4G3]
MAFWPRFNNQLTCNQFTCSLFPVPCSLFPVPYSLFPVPFAI